MLKTKPWIPLLGSIPLAVAAAGVQGAGSPTSESGEGIEQRTLLGETARPTAGEAKASSETAAQWNALDGCDFWHDLRLDD